MTIDRGLLSCKSENAEDSQFFDLRKRGEQGPLDCAKLLPKEFIPTNWDVICLRGKQSHNHSKYHHVLECCFSSRKTYLFSSFPRLEPFQLAIGASESVSRTT